MQIKIVRHHRSAQDANTHIKHILVGKDPRPGHKPQRHSGKAGFGKDQLQREATADDRNQSNDDRFDITKASGLQIQYQQHIQGRYDTTPHQGNPKQKLQTNG
jgi:hypothetical protein